MTARNDTGTARSFDVVVRKRAQEMPLLSRRGLFFAGVAAVLASQSRADAPAIHVAKGTGCECCDQWAAHVRENGFVVTDESLYGTLLIRFKMERGVPQAAYSCHTGVIDGYVIEGHAPAADIRRLLSERPDAIGLAVPGMPYGSPGMGPDSEREAYDVLLIRKDGSMEVFASYPKA